MLSGSSDSGALQTLTAPSSSKVFFMDNGVCMVL